MGFERKLTSIALMSGVALMSACASTPAFQGWTPEQLMQYGEQAMADGEWGDAQDAFERLVTTFPAYEGAVKARHNLAQAFFADEEYLSAVSEFTRIVQVYPDDAQTPAAWMGLCRSYSALAPHPQRDQQYTVQARTTCQNVANDFRGTPVGDSALVESTTMNRRLAEKAYAEGRFYFQRDVLESAELVFLDLIERFPQTPSAAQAVARLVDIYTEWGWDDQLEEQRTRLLEQYPDSPEARAMTATAAVTDTTAVPEPDSLGAGSDPRG